MSCRSDILIECNEKMFNKIMEEIKRDIKEPYYLPTIVRKNNISYFMEWQNIPKVDFIKKILSEHADDEAYAKYEIGADLSDSSEEYSDNYGELLGSHSCYILRDFCIPSDAKEIDLTLGELGIDSTILGAEMKVGKMTVEEILRGEKRMKLVIDIPEELHSRIKNNNVKVVDNIPMASAINDGTPLPKGHGDLKDIGDLKYVFDLARTDKIYSGKDIERAIKFMTAIIPADTSMENEVIENNSIRDGGNNDSANNFFSINVQEVLERVVEVKATSYEDALEQVRKQYRNCDIVLDAEDLKETTIS